MSIKGEKNILFIWDTAWKPVACLTSNGLSTTLGIIESQTKCFPGVVKKTPGTFSYSISAEGEYIDTTTAGGEDTKASHDALLLLQLSKSLVDFKIDTNVDDAASTKYFGSAYITELELTADAGDEVQTFSATLDGDGALVLTDTHPSV